MGQVVCELVNQGLLRVRFPTEPTTTPPSTSSTEYSYLPEHPDLTTMESVAFEVLNCSQDKHQPMSRDTSSERAEYCAETSEAAETHTDASMESSLADILEYYENDEPSRPPEQGEPTGPPGSLEDVLNSTNVGTDTTSNAERPLSPEPVMWGDVQPGIPNSPGPYSDQPSEHGCDSDSSGTASTHTSFDTPLEPPVRPTPRPMQLFDGRTTKDRMIYHLDLIRRAETHCAQLIDEKGLLADELHEAKYKHLLYNAEVAKLKLEKGNLSRKNDDLRYEIMALKKELKHCAQNHR